MAIRKTVTLVEEINSEYGAPAREPLRRVAIAVVFASAHLTANAATDAAAKTATLTLMIILINTAWLIVGASLAPLLRDRRRSRIVNVTLAVTLVGATALAVVYQA